MKNCILFVRGTYRAGHLGFYKRLCHSKVRIAVDGGYSFFKRAGLRPDVLMGDFDSVAGLPRKLSPQTRVIKFPVRKDKTDSQLAVEYCIEHKARNIDMVMPGVGDMDHFIGNLMLLTSSKVTDWVKSGGKIRILSARGELRFVKDGGAIFRNAVGDTVSVIPLSQRIILSWTGTDYDVEKVSLRRGESRSLRNRVRSRRAIVTVEGEAFIWRGFAGKPRID